MNARERDASRLLRWAGLSLMAGGLVTAGLNLAFTPLLSADRGFAETAASTLFLWRQSTSAVAAALLLFGSVGLYVRQIERLGPGGTAVFVAAFFGSALLLAWEWVDVFVLRSLALKMPAALDALEEAPGIDLYDLAALIPITLFTAGWLAFAAVSIRARVVATRGPWLVIAGFVLTPALTAVAGLWGAAAGAAILGAGFFELGRAVARDVASTRA